MLRSRLFWKLFLTFAVVNLLASGGLLWLALEGMEESAFRQAEQRLWWLGGMVGLALLAATYLVVAQVVRPVLRLSAAANAIAGGDYTYKPAFVTSRDELGLLAAAFNRMSSVLDRQFTQLRNAQQRQSAVLEGMVEGVLAIDPDQHIVLANRAVSRLLNLQSDKLVGRQLIVAIRNHQLQDAVAQVLQTGEPQSLEIEWQGTEALRLSLQVTPLPGEPVQGAVIVLHNITELRRLESLRQEFVANVSHELKTPLSSIKAYTETLIDGALHDEQHAMQFLSQIDDQTNRLTALIQDMLRLARIESEEETFEVTSVLVSEAAAACLRDYAANAEARRISLAAETDDPHLLAMADPEGLRVILNNLVDNAIKYTPDGGSVTLAWNRNEQGQILIEVSDTGIGIPADSLPRVFERFHRVDKARSREMGGTGLGLSIVKHLAQAFGGAVAVRSALNKGSTFSVTLPAGSR